MDDRERLYKLAKENGLEPHSRHGVPKLQEMLLDAGIAFELVDTPSEREKEIVESLAEVAKAQDPDLEIPHPGAPKAEKVEQPTAEAEKPAPAPAKSQSDTVEVLVMVKNVHVAATDLGRAPSGTSVKIFFKERHKLPRAIAERLAGRGQVEIL
jgi:hypothetical protein